MRIDCFLNCKVSGHEVVWPVDIRVRHIDVEPVRVARRGVGWDSPFVEPGVARTNYNLMAIWIIFIEVAVCPQRSGNGESIP